MRQELDAPDAMLCENIENQITVLGMFQDDVLLELPL